MRNQSILRPLLACILAALLVASPSVVFASGFQIVEQSGSGLGNAYAGQAASVKDASAIHFNPANLTRVKGKQFLVSVEPIGVKTTFSDTASTRPFLPTTPPLPVSAALGSDGGDAGGWIPVPNGYFSWQAAEKVWVGLGVNAPFGLKTEWDADWMGRFHAIKSEVKTLNINPTVAFEVNEVLSIGAGASYQQLTAELTRAVPYGGIAVGAASRFGAAATAGILAQLGGPSGLVREGVATVEGDEWAWGFNVGATVKLGEQGRLAATYRSRTKYDLQGDVTFTNAPTFATAGPIGALGAGLNARFANGEVTTEIELPETISGAISYETEKWELMADYTWTGWSSIQQLAIDRTDGSELSNESLKFDDTYRVGVGFGYQLNDAWKLRLGTAYDTAPVQDQYRTPRLPDNDRVWAAAGVEYKVGEKGALDIGYAHLFIDDASSNLANQEAAGAAPTGNLVGTYKASVNIISLQYRHSF